MRDSSIAALRPLKGGEQSERAPLRLHRSRLLCSLKLLQIMWFL